MKRTLKNWILSGITLCCMLCMSVGFSACDWENRALPKRAVTYYGVVQTWENSDDLVVFIPSLSDTQRMAIQPTDTLLDPAPSHGVYRVPDLDGGVLKENDLIALTFDINVKILETYPMQFSQKPLRYAVEKENVGLVYEDNGYILTTDYTQKLQEDFAEFQLTIGDRVQFFVKNGSYVMGNEYMNVRIADVKAQRLSLRLELGERSIQDFLRTYAEDELEILTEMYEAALYTETKEIGYEKWTAAYTNYFTNAPCYVIDDYETYEAFYRDVIGTEVPMDEERWATVFDDGVLFGYAREVSGTAAFIPVEASYLYTSNKIIRREVYQPEEGVEFPAVIVAYCIDFVEVPKDIFERLNEK